MCLMSFIPYIQIHGAKVKVPICYLCLLTFKFMRMNRLHVNNCHGILFTRSSKGQTRLWTHLTQVTPHQLVLQVKSISSEIQFICKLLTCCRSMLLSWNNAINVLGYSIYYIQFETLEFYLHALQQGAARCQLTTSYQFQPTYLPFMAGSSPGPKDT